MEIKESWTNKVIDLDRLEFLHITSFSFKALCKSCL